MTAAALAESKAVPKFSRALVLEDDRELRSTVSRWLRQCSGEVVTASNVREGLDLLSTQPELVIVDVCLPDGRGHTVARAALQQVPKPLVIAVSGAASMVETFDLARAGVHAFLPKPFTQHELAKRIAIAQQRHRPRALSLATVPEDALSEQTRARLETNISRFMDGRALSESCGEVLWLAAIGVPRSKLAKALNISENTCKDRIKQILRGSGFGSLGDLARHLALQDPNHPL
jgi:DNA-binding NarL/FixJ family response regulator